MSAERKKTLWIWGDNSSSELGRSDDNSPTVSCTPVLQLQDVGVKHFSLGKTCGVLNTEDEKCYQVGQPGTVDLTLSGIEATLCEVSTLNSHKVTEVSCGFHHITVLTKPGTAFCWGVSNYGQCGVVADVVTEPKVVELHYKQKNLQFMSIACGKNHTMAVSSEYELWGWGLSHLTGSGNATRHANPCPNPEVVEHLCGRKVLQVSCGKYHTAALTEKIVKHDSSVLRPDSVAVCGYCKEEIYKMHDSDDQVVITDTHICTHIGHRLGVVGEDTPTSDKHKAPTHNRSASLPFMKHTSPLLAKRDRISRTPPSLPRQSLTIANASSNESLLSVKSEIVNHTGEKVELVFIPKSMEKSSENTAEPCPGSIENENVTKVRARTSEKNSTVSTSPFPKSLSLPGDLWKQRNISDSSEVLHSPSKFLSNDSSNTSPGSSSPSLTSLDEVKSGMTSPLLPNELNLDRESALTYLNYLSPDGSRDHLVESNPQGVEINAQSDERQSQTNGITIVENVEEMDETGTRKSISERITQSITDNQLLSPLTSYSKNVFTGVMDRFEWIKTSTYDKGVVPIREFLSKDKTLQKVPSDKTLDSNTHDDPLRSHEQIADSAFEKTDCDNHLTLHTEVWTWGENTHGQLGFSDRLDRFQPSCVKTLGSRGIVKIRCGAHHTVVLTSNSEAYSWGSNAQGQLGHAEENSCNPIKVECENRIWDIATGRRRSLFLVDAVSDEPVILSCGDDSCKKRGPPHPLKSKEKKASRKCKVCPVEFSHEMGYASTIMSGFSTLSSCLSEKNSSIATLHSFAKAERDFYQHLTMIKVEVLRPFKFSDLYKHIDGSSYADILSRTLDLFGQLAYDIGLNTVYLTQAVTSGAKCEEETFSYIGEGLIQSFQKYYKSLNDAIAFGFFEKFEALCAKHIKFFSKPNVSQLFKKLLGDKRLSKLPSENFLQLLQLPAVRLRDYTSTLNKFAVALEEEVHLCTFLENLSAQWEKLRNSINSQIDPANNTRAFWKDEFKAGGSAKLAESLKKVGRYMMVHSKKVPLDIAHSGRFSLNWFILFNDCLVLVHYGTHVSHPVETIWCNSMVDPKEKSHLIKITTPEEEIIAAAPTDEAKAKWISSFHRAINSIVNKSNDVSSPHRENTQYHRLPPATRHASYTFTKDTELKGATYHGAWLAGKPHGKGEMAWEDGRKYKGSYRNGGEDGYGEWTAAPGSTSKLKYLGWWKKGKMDGYGKLWYSQFQAYEGSFVSGRREGHGVLRTGSVVEGSVYVGDWKKDKRSGFGVEDNITKGEKYLGMWANNQRHGAGILVTLDGLYGQSRFTHGEMSGDTLLIEGRYAFEGHISAGMVLNGKGRLTLPTGDKLEGSFSGPWGENIRVSGNLTRLENIRTTRPESPKTPIEPTSSSTQMSQKDHARSILRRYNRHIMKKHADSKHGRSFPLSLHPDLKWTEIFLKCCVLLACPSKDDPTEETNTRKIWEAISVAMSNAKRMRDELKHSRLSPQRKVDETRLNWLERVPTVVTENKEIITQDDINSIKEYLAQAFSTTLHPLGDLAESLGNVFRDSYSGAGAQKWLLMQAVADVRSFVRRTYNILRCMFPQLDKEHGVSHANIIQNHTEEDNSEDFSNFQNETVTAGDLVLPVILPRVYPTLFTLYALRHEKEDNSYWERVTRLNRHPDVALLSYLDVKPKFWMLDEKEIPPLESVPEDGQLYGSVEQAESSKWRHLLVARARDCSFLSAVETLQLISTTFIPAEKLNVIHSAFKEINATVLEHHKQTHTWSMDDLFPVFQYVVIRSRISHLGCEIQLIEDFLEPDMCKGEKGIMFTTLKACYFQIRVEKDL